MDRVEQDHIEALAGRDESLECELANVQAERDSLTERNMELQAEIDRIKRQTIYSDEGGLRWEALAEAVGMPLFARLAHLRIAAEDAANGCREAMMVGLAECDRLREKFAEERKECDTIVRSRDVWKEKFRRASVELSQTKNRYREDDEDAHAALDSAKVPTHNDDPNDGGEPLTLVQRIELLAQRVAMAERRETEAAEQVAKLVKAHERELAVAVANAKATTACNWREFIAEELSPLHAHGMPHETTLRQAVRWMVDVLTGVDGMRQEVAKANKARAELQRHVGQAAGLEAEVGLLVGRTLRAEEALAQHQCDTAYREAAIIWVLGPTTDPRGNALTAAEYVGEERDLLKERLQESHAAIWGLVCCASERNDRARPSWALSIDFAWRESIDRELRLLHEHGLPKGSGLTDAVRWMSEVLDDRLWRAKGQSQRDHAVHEQTHRPQGDLTERWEDEMKSLYVGLQEPRTIDAKEENTLDGVGRHDAYLARNELERRRKALAKALGAPAAFGWSALLDAARRDHEDAVTGTVACDAVQARVDAAGQRDSEHEELPCTACAAGHRTPCTGMRAVRVGAGACVIDGPCGCPCRAQQARA